MAHLVCFIISCCAGSALNLSRQIHAFHSAVIEYKSLLKTNRISVRGITKLLTKNDIFLVFTEVSILTKFMASN